MIGGGGGGGLMKVVKLDALGGNRGITPPQKEMLNSGNLRKACAISSILNKIYSAFIFLSLKIASPLIKNWFGLLGNFWALLKAVS